MIAPCFIFTLTAFFSVVLSLPLIQRFWNLFEIWKVTAANPLFRLDLLCRNLCLASIF